MKSKADSVHVFEVRLWSKKHWEEGITHKNIYEGHIIDCKDRKAGQKHFHSPSQFLSVIEILYKKHEKRKS